jgi:hypothetical protein
MNRFAMGNDGISYLDMADNYLRGNWHPLNTSWNPLYAWLIAIDLGLFHPSPRWQFLSVQMLNFLIYIPAVIAFEYFVRAVLPARKQDGNSFRWIAYSLFLWATLILIRTSTVSPDMLIAATVFAAVGLLTRAHETRQISFRSSVAFGLILAAGYYSKAVMFLLGLVLLVIAFGILPWRKAALAGIVFFTLTLPFVGLLSRSVERFTFGDTGRVNFPWDVNGVASRWWQGGPAGSGRSIHTATQIVLNSPRVYSLEAAFRTFPHATYSVWYDFAYWYQGLHVEIVPRQIIHSPCTI